jgi:hypothetical protein
VASNCSAAPSVNKVVAVTTVGEALVNVTLPPRALEQNVPRVVRRSVCVPVVDTTTTRDHTINPAHS